MRKPITCHSRDARAYFALRINGSQGESQPDYIGKDPDDDLRRNLHDEAYKKILDDESTWLLSESTPIKISSRVSWYSEYRRFDMAFGCEYWLYKNRLYLEADKIDFTNEQRMLLVREEFDIERIQFEKLKAKFSDVPTDSRTRSKIPSNVRIFVWQRDSGRCVECSSNENLEYDHIIPFAKGGSNTERNLQLLCGDCNRLKSDRIQ